MTRIKEPFRKLLIVSVLITVFIFYGEYFVWDKSPGPVDIKTMLLEFITIGSMYILLIWGLASFLYFVTNKAASLLRRLF